MTQTQPLDLRFSLIIDGTTYVLPNAPDGWENCGIKWKRSDDFFGIVRNYSVPLQFVLDGAWLLRREFYSNGLQGGAVLVIEELNKKTWQYFEAYRGDLDISTFNDLPYSVEISAMEGGIIETVKAFETVEFEIPLNVPGAVKVLVPGIGLTESANVIFDIDVRGFGFNWFEGGLLSLLGLDIVINDLDSQYLIVQSVEPFGSFGTNLFETSDRWFVRATQETKVGFSGTLKGRFTLRTEAQTMYIEVRNNFNVVIQRFATFVGASSGTNSIPFEIPITLEHEMAADERLFVVAGVTGEMASLNSFLYLDEGNIDVSNNLVTPDTFAFGMRPFTLMQTLLNLMNENVPVEARSFLLQNTWPNLIITSGDAIRGIANPKLKTSWRDFFDSINAVLSAGFGTENGVAVIESKSYWMKDGLIAVDLGEVDDFSLKPAGNYIYNTIKVGYESNDYDVDYGREEVNNGQNWRTPIRRVQKVLNLISPYRADQFGIEEARTIPVEDNTNKADNSTDNDTFFIKIQKEPTEDYFLVEGAEHYREGDGIQGVSARQSYYNLDLTPKKNLLRHGAFLRSFLHTFEGRLLRFESADKNSDLVTIDLIGRRVAEKEPIQINQLSAPIFKPYVATFKAKIPYTVAGLLSTYPTGKVAFKYQGIPLEGFVEEVAADVAKNAEKQWTVLIAPNVDLTPLIR